MKYYIILFVLLISVVYCSKPESKKVSLDKASEYSLSKLPGSHFDTTLLCEGLRDSVETPLLWNENSENQLIIYFDETMCTTCVEEALKFYMSQLTFLPEEQVKFITRFNNKRRISILFRFNKIEQEFCNVNALPFKADMTGNDKPIFLIVNKVGEIKDYFQLKENMKKRIRASIHLLKAN